MIKIILNFLPKNLLIRLSNYLQPIVDLLYKGNKFIDPINGKSYRKFLSYGYKIKRKNVLSPGTFSLERHRSMYLFLKNETPFFKQKLDVLHIAPEQCFIKKFKKLSNINYLTLDLNSPIADIQANILNLPFKKESFDVIFCNHVLEHIKNDYKAMKELYRVMKKGGFGIFQVPIKKSLKKTYEDFSITESKKRTKYFGQYNHVRIYGIDYFDRLEKVGFQVFPIKYYKKLKKEIIKKYALDSYEILPYVKKK